MCFFLPNNFTWNIFWSYKYLSRYSQDAHTNACKSASKVSLIFPQFWPKFACFSTKNITKLTSFNFIKIHSVVITCRRTDRHTDIAKLLASVLQFNSLRILHKFLILSCRLLSVGQAVYYVDVAASDTDSLVSFLSSWLTCSCASCAVILVEGRHVTA